MATLNGFPVYQVQSKEAEDGKGLDFVSLVDVPAIQTNWVAMSKAVSVHLNEDKQLLYGPILIPDQYIERYDAKLGTYYIVFSKETIAQLVRKFQTEQKTVNLNYQHKDNSKLNNAVIQEIWLTGTPDKSNSMGFELPEGSAFVGAYIGDKEFWLKEVKTGNVKGFSIEGFLDIKLKKIKMGEVKLIQANLSDGTVIKSDTEKWEVGAEVYSEKEESKIPLEDGEYDLGNGQAITVKDNKIESINEVVIEENAELKEMLKPVTDLINAELAELKNKIIELETKLANQPASKKETKEDKPKELTAYERLQKVHNKNKKQTA
jgi:hypothetical protein